MILIDSEQKKIYFMYIPSTLSKPDTFETKLGVHFREVSAIETVLSW